MSSGVWTGGLQGRACGVLPREPGSMGGVLLTGGLSEGMREVLRQTVGVLRSMVQPRAQELGVADSKRLSLHKAGHDLHVYVTNARVARCGAGATWGQWRWRWWGSCWDGGRATRRWC